MAEEVKHDDAHATHDNKKFPRGALPSPRHVLAAACPFRPVPTLVAPTQFAVVPPKLSMWFNNQVGDCVTAEEAFAKAAWSVMNGLPELFIPDQEVYRWAQKYGFLNGAMLDEVMDRMAVDGFTVNGVNYHDGPKQSVDYSAESVLQPAITQGVVKIAIDADALSNSAGNVQGWYSVGGSPGQFPNTDHCVGLSGFGPAEYLYQQLGVPMPSALAGKFGYLLFTWSTIGFVDHAWLMSTCVEAWVRNPTTPEQQPTPTPPPVPPSPPVPPPPVPVTSPIYDVQGMIPSGVWGTLKPFTAVATPRAQHFFAPAGAVNWWAAIGDAFQIVVDVRAKNYAAAAVDVIKLLADFGINIPQEQHGHIAPLIQQVHAANIDPWTVLQDAFSLFLAVRTWDVPTIVAAAQKLLADLGINVTL